VSQYSVDVDPGRVNNSHSFVVQLVGKGKSVLERGAASGHVTRILASNGNRVTAVEADIACSDSLAAVADEVLIRDLDRLSLSEDLDGRTFDVIVAGDVLEHTKRPELILAQLHGLLAPSGYIVVSLPHIAHGDVRLSLLSGQFPYSDRGLLDKTHLRFFTRSTILELFSSAGFNVDEIYGTTAPLGTTELGVDLSSFTPEVLQAVYQAPDSDVYQFVVKATPVEMPNRTLLEEIGPKKHDATREDLLFELSAINSVLQATRNQLKVQELQLSEANNSISALTQKLQAAEQDLQGAKQDLLLSRLEQKDYIIGKLAELGEARSRLEILEEQSNETLKRLEVEMTRAFNAETRLVELEPTVTEIRRLRDEVRMLRHSRSFRLGRHLTAPFRILRKLVK